MFRDGLLFFQAGCSSFRFHLRDETCSDDKREIFVGFPEDCQDLEDSSYCL